MNDFLTKRDPRKTAMRMSLLVTGVMLAGKLTAYFLTSSTAIFSDAAESIIHVVATGLAAASLWYASVPADHTHPYGHGKISFFSAGFEGALILIAAFGVIFAGIRDLLIGPHLHDLGLGLGIILLLTFINLALGLYLLRVGKKYQSIIVEANGRHVLTDMWTSAGVVVGVTLVLLTGQYWIDPVVAILMGINILWTALHLIWQSFQGLMDVADPCLNARLKECLGGAVDEKLIHGYHLLRHRTSGDEIYVEVHLLFPRQMTMAQAHGKVNIVEELIAQMFPEKTVHVTSHPEPADHEHAHPDGHKELGGSEKQGS